MKAVVAGGRRERFTSGQVARFPDDPAGAYQGAQQEKPRQETPREGAARHRQTGLTPARCR